MDIQLILIFKMQTCKFRKVSVGTMLKLHMNKLAAAKETLETGLSLASALPNHSMNL